MTSRKKLGNIFAEVVHKTVNDFLDAVFEKADEILLSTKTQKCYPQLAFRLSTNSRTLLEIRREPELYWTEPRPLKKNPINSAQEQSFLPS
jgi:hypothetical protein